MNKTYLTLLMMTGLICACSQTKEVNGTLRMGHEVRSFTNNSDHKEYWLIDKSQSLMPAYQKIIGQEVASYQPIHARLQVKDIGKLEDGFGAEYDGSYEVKKIIALSYPQLLGAWVENVPNMPNLKQGFVLEEDGTASSVNMATLQYSSWQQNGNELILSGKSIGNHQTIDFTDRYKIQKLTEDTLVLQSGSRTYTYKKQK